MPFCFRHPHICQFAVLAFAVVTVGLSGLPLSAASRPVLTLRNNHETPFSGDLRIGVTVPDGYYAASPAGAAYAVVKDGAATFHGHLPPQKPVRLVRSTTPRTPDRAEIRADTFTAPFSKNSTRVDYGLVVIPGTSADTSAVPDSFHPLTFSNAPSEAGATAKHADASGYSIDLTARPAGTCVDYTARVRNTSGKKEPAYIAFVRRVRLEKGQAFAARYNGSVSDSLDPPPWGREFWYVRWLDWLSWQERGQAFAMINGFSPGFMTQTSKGNWIVANHFYIWEKVIQRGNDLYFISEIAGPNPEQAKSSFIRVTEYTQPQPDQPVTLRWRLARPAKPFPGWQDSQLLIWAGARSVAGDSTSCTVDLGVRSVQFGASYFPYSTFAENFDYYRVPGLDRESWWPFSPDQWRNWRAYKPRMQTDLRIIKAIGLQWVRLHHLELLGQMDRKQAMDFLDFYIGECRSLGLKVLIDTTGSSAWLQSLTGRYKDVVKRVELENEVLIPGIQPGDPERWTAMYHAVKEVAPDTQVFLTGSANQAVWEALQRFHVPFDRVGLHMYKHGPGDEEAFSSLALGVGACATQMGKAVTLGEFNWKELTRMTPEARARQFALIYANMLKPRAIPEFLEFHFQETLSVNPRVSRQGLRHYEIINLDRRPKPETFEFMKLIQKYAPLDAPVREVSATAPSVTLKGGLATATFTIRNLTGRTLKLGLEAEAFDGLSASFTGKPPLTLKPGQSIKLGMKLTLKDGLPGTYHAFVRISYENATAYGWLVASNPGPPHFEAPVIPERVTYEGGPEAVTRLPWDKATCVTFTPDCPVLELEMAYLIRNTLQAATGRDIYLCPSDKIPTRFQNSGLIIRVASRTHASSRKKLTDDLPPAPKGVVLCAAGQHPALEITGETAEDVEAAAVDFVLRYWKGARDAAIRLTGLEKGAALGNRAAVGEVNPP